MALHRDIYWVGKQWAVTGNGVQACDQKQKSQFDIDPTRLWDDDVVDRLRANKWLNVDDLEKALSIARQRFSEPPRKVTPAPRVAPIEPPPPVVNPKSPKQAKPDPVEPPRAPAVVLQPSAATKTNPEPPRPAGPKFHMLFSGNAKFIRPWRVRMRK